MNTKFIVPVYFVMVLFFSCTREKPMKTVIDESLAFSVRQYSLMADVMKNIAINKSAYPKMPNSLHRLDTSK